MSLLTSPAHGGQLRSLAAELGCRPQDILDFSVNINPDGPPLAVLTAMRAALGNSAILTNYPELDSSRVRHAIATHCGIAPEAVVLANGFVPLLEAALRAHRVTSCLLPVPSFTEYRRTLTQSAVNVIPHALAHTDFRYNIDALIDHALQSGATAILLANPQNPSGALTLPQELTRLTEALPNVLILLDEAFIDYTPASSLLPLCARLANTIVFRSVTKFYAIPGLRIAYALATAQHADQMRAHLPPWPVTTLAEIALEAALTDDAYAERSLAHNQTRRATLAGAISALGIRFLPSVTNFLLLHLPCDAEQIRERLLRDHRIHVRTCANFESLPGNYLRIAVRSPADNERLVTALAAVLPRH